MSRKNNIRSIRFSDELGELIEGQPGQNFTEKFENLVTRCVWELPARKKELAELERRIQEKRAELLEMSDKARRLEATITELFPRVYDLEHAIDKAVEKWRM